MTNTTFQQAYDLLCDQLLGYGMSRQVFSSKLLPDCVIKVEEDAGKFQNVVEWETWLRVRNTPYSSHFAACRWISNNGSILIMERTRPPGINEYPEEMPVFLCDFKRTNYGMSQLPAPKSNKPGNHFVCHDYGTSMIFEHGMTKRLKKVEWYDA